MNTKVKTQDLENKLINWIDKKNQELINARFWANNENDLQGSRITKPNENKHYTQVRLVQYKDAPLVCDFYRVTAKGTYVCIRGIAEAAPIHYVKEDDIAYNARTLNPINIKPNDYIVVFSYVDYKYKYNAESRKYTHLEMSEVDDYYKKTFITNKVV
jgi:hypothetical protein